MNNTFFLIGRLTKEPEEKQFEDGKKYVLINVAVPRQFKNIDGIYETDFINIILWGGIADNTKEYCRKGDLIGTKGRIETVPTTNDEGFINGREIRLVADKVTLLSSRKENTNESINN